MPELIMTSSPSAAEDAVVDLRTMGVSASPELHPSGTSFVVIYCQTLNGDEMLEVIKRSDPHCKAVTPW
jgi:hypothetical protein